MNQEPNIKPFQADGISIQVFACDSLVIPCLFRISKDLLRKFIIVWNRVSIPTAPMNNISFQDAGVIQGNRKLDLGLQGILALLHRWPRSLVPS